MAVGRDIGHLDATEEHERSSASHRRLLLRRGLLSAVPVLATLASGPVAAGVCTRASGFVSVATFKSRHPGALSNCEGLSPSQWIVLDKASWPDGVYKGNDTGDDGKGTGTKFNAIFDPDLTVNKSLLVVLKGYAEVVTVQTIAAAVAAMWLNAKAGKTGGIFAPDEVKMVWSSVCANNGYLPPGGKAAWTLPATQTWIATTWGSIPA
jgi:hypothetical protein